MRRLLLAVLLSIAASPVAADLATWQWSFGPAGYRASMGTSYGASDDLDALDAFIGSNPYINIATYHEQGVSGWTASTGFLSSDVRGPLAPTPGQTKSWRMYYWNNLESPATWTTTDFTWLFGAGGSDDPPSNVRFALTFVRPPVGMETWDPPLPYASPTLGETVLLNERPEGNWLLWTYRTDNGLDGYVFDLTAMVIPEPSSLLALCAGIGAMGAGIRRRKP